MRRRAWFDWHSWVGLNLSLLMAFVVFTGTLATVSTELDWLTNPAKRASVPAAGGPLPVGTMLASFVEAFPGARPTQLRLPRERWVAPELIAIDTDGARIRVFFDRSSGAVQGTGRWFTWQRFLREAHRHLMLPLEIGLTVVALLSIPLLVSFFSSMYVYKRWWRGFFRLPRRTAGASRAGTEDRNSKRRYWGDLHRLAGVWSLWFVLLMGVTGAWYLAEHLGLDASLPPLAAKPRASESARLLDTDPRALDDMLERAASAYLSLAVQSILLDAYGGAVVLQGQADAILVRDRANHVAFDGHSGELLDLRRGELLDLHNRISEAADPLHFGDFGGPLTRYLWALFGVAMTTLSLTGVYLYGLRTLASLRALAAGARAAWRTALVGIPGRYALPQGLLIAVCLALAVTRFLAH